MHCSFSYVLAIFRILLLWRLTNCEIHLCLKREHFDGTWKFRNITEGSNPKERCPVISSDSTIPDYVMAHMKPEKYQCLEYERASFSPRDPMICRLRSFNTSLTFLQSIFANGSIVFMGDSLSMQHYVAAICDSENVSTHLSGLRFENVRTLFVRPDLPCSNTCLTNKTYRAEELEKYSKGRHMINYCAGCPEGQIHDQCVYVEGPGGTRGKFITASQHWWNQAVPEDARVVIINSGAWYNFQHGMGTPVQEYKRTIIELMPVLAAAIARGVIVAWMPVPVPTPGRASPKSWNRELFMSMNNIIKQYLPRLGVLYIERMSHVVMARKVQDPNSSMDDLHWCNLGPSTVPSFSNQVYFHFISLHAQLVSQRQGKKTHFRNYSLPSSCTI